MNFDYVTERTDIFVVNGHGAEPSDMLVDGGWRYPANLIDPLPDGHNMPPWFNANEFGKMYATCWYTFEALTDSLIAAGETPPPFGLIAAAVGGSKIEQWVEWGAQQMCKNISCCENKDCTQPEGDPWPDQPTHAACVGNAQIYNGVINPLVNTTVKVREPHSTCITASTALDCCLRWWQGFLWYQGENSICCECPAHTAACTH
jgi:hypothetical protein